MSGVIYEEELAKRGDKAHILDADHFYNFIVGSWSTREDRIVGILFWHRAADGVRACGGFVAFERGPDRPDRPIWTIEKWEPLTLSPSILCKGEHGKCGGSHGYIRDGQWVPA